MEDALKDIPIKNIDMPEGISFVRINKDTGLIGDDIDLRRRRLLFGGHKITLPVV